jgi:dCMP deaminase
VIVPGYNGTVSGSKVELELNNVTTSDCIHAELNGVLKAAKEGICLKGSTLYVTLSPCEMCAPMIAQVEVARVVYDEVYRDVTGLNKLIYDYGVIVEKFVD